jgi:dTDP-4-dehydrorhamnose reductase
MKLIITGSSGLLGTELKKHLIGPNYVWLTRREMDITHREMVWDILRHPHDAVLHLAAYTDVAKAEKERAKCYEVNVVGTDNVARNARRLIYISSDYVFDGERGNYNEHDMPCPTNHYSWTKLAGEYEARHAEEFNIIRTSFKPRPFEYPKAVSDKFTSAGYVDEIAAELAKALRLIAVLPPVLHIGMERSSVYDLAKRTRPNVQPITLADLDVRLPKDTSLDCTRWQRLQISQAP